MADYITHIYIVHYNINVQCISVAFKLYDLDGDEKISRDELLAVLHMMVGANISEEQVSTCCTITQSGL